MKYKCITGGPISENCYLLIDEKTNQAAVVDPGFLNDVLLNEIKKYTVQRILLTHGHFDHIWEADRLHEMLGVPVCAYETVSYTHLDVYKRQRSRWLSRCRAV